LIWRRSYATAAPNGESLAATFDRVIPCYQKEIEPKLKDDENILIVAHGNSLRALMIHLENISPAEIAEVNIVTGVPRVYELTTDLKLSNVHYVEQ
jgi:2,3-bisphosphoglycerate-dependent phosphoglycerate mutase